MKSVFSRFFNDESGATAIEYSLIAALIGVVIISATRTLGTSISAKFGAVANNLT
jgi:pilus assembly protein Flp/PilA